MHTRPVVAGLVRSLEAVGDDGPGGDWEVRSALEWAEVKAMAADGVSTSEIARRLGVNWRTAARLVAAAEPPSYSRAPTGSMLDPLEPVLRDLIANFEDIKAPRVTEILREEHGYEGSVDLVRKRLATLRPRGERPAQRTAIGRGRCCRSIGARCRRGHGSPAESAASTRWCSRCRSRGRRRRTSRSI